MGPSQAGGDEQIRAHVANLSDAELESMLAAIRDPDVMGAIVAHARAQGVHLLAACVFASAWCRWATTRVHGTTMTHERWLSLREEADVVAAYLVASGMDDTDRAVFDRVRASVDRAIDRAARTAAS